MRTKYAIHAGIIFAASACSQDVEAPPQAKATGAPGSTWTVKGALSDPSLIGANVLMVGSDGSVSSSAVGEGGAFAIEVSGGASYAMHFTRDGEFVGVLTFNKTEAGGTTSVFGLPKREVASANFASTTGALEESEPSAEQPAAEEPASEEPAAEQPAAEQPAAEEPAAEEPAAEEPAAEEPAAEQPPAAEPAAPTADPAPTAATEDAVAPEPTSESEPAPTDSIDLGDIVIEGGQAVPENNPAAQVDSDGDGTVDLADADDDQDGVPDALDSVAMPDSPAAPLTIASVTPSAGQAGVEADDAVDIAFTAPLDSASITSTTAFVMNAEGVVVSAEPSVSADGVRVSLEPATQYEEGATYTVVVTDDVKSADGRPVASEWTSDFVIGAEPADGAPLAPFHVKSIEPLNGANDVSTKVKLQVKFDQEVEDASVYFGDGSFTLVDQNGVPVAGELSVDHKKIRFEPNEELAPGATYVITVGTDVESSDGATLEAPLTLSFQTKAKVGNGQGGKPDDKGGKPEDDEDDDKGGKPEDDEDDDKGGKPEDKGGKPEDDEDDEDDDKGGKPEDKGGKPEDDEDDEDDDKGGKPEDKGGKPEDTGDKPEDDEHDETDDKGGKPEDKGGKPEDKGDKPEDDEHDEDEDKGDKPEDKGGKPEDKGGKPKDKGGKPEGKGDDEQKPEDGEGPDEADEDEADKDEADEADEDEADEDEADEDEADEDEADEPEGKGGKPEDKGGKPAKDDDEPKPEDDSSEPAADDADEEDEEDEEDEPPPGKAAGGGAGNGKPPKK